MYEKLDEKVEVLVHFTTHKPIPLALIWNGKRFKIDTVNFAHISHEGKSPIIHFSVSTKKEAFNISFNTHELTWTLHEIFFEGFTKDTNLN